MPTMRRFVYRAVLTAAIFSSPSVCRPQVAADPLQQGFQTPPRSARPLVWWHWMNGNISQEGIQLDLEWMSRIGIAGFHNFDAALATPQVVPKRLAYMTPEWQDAFRYATRMASQLHLEEGIASSPGWSETGGPWVSGPHAMKKYVWSETVLEGSTPFKGILAHPPAVTGPFQGLPIDDSNPFLTSKFKAPQFYADSAVIAYKLPASDASAPQLPRISTSGHSEAAVARDGSLGAPVEVPNAKPGEKAWVQFEYAQPQTVRAVSLISTGGPMEGFMGPTGSGRALEASEDGASFRVIALIPATRCSRLTVEIPSTTARFFRVTFLGRENGPNPFAGMEDFGNFQPPPQSTKVSELALSATARVNHLEEQAGFCLVPDASATSTTDVPASDIVAKSDVIDLTGKMHSDGSLEWTPPPGRWVVMRLGYSLLGVTNHPATDEATGLEVDKLNGGFVKQYMDAYLGSYEKAVGPEWMGTKGIRYVVTDSWEAGAQNWTDNMLAEFQQRRGYDPRPWLPVLSGRIVESGKASDGFLWDLRKTIADLIADEHYGLVETSLKARGIGHYGESHEDGRALIADGMEVKKLDDIPMSAYWAQPVADATKNQFGYDADDRESASVAHIYGQNLAAAESLTTALAPWSWSPSSLKPSADQEMLNGINRFVIHESAHQPLRDKAPGLTLGPFGQWFNRNETWAEQAGPWIDYLARSSFMLQLGRFAADVVYFYGEDSNLTALYADHAPEVPAGYAFDYINADGLIHELAVRNGMLVTRSGMQYRMLGLAPHSRQMSLPVLRALAGLVRQGASVAGPKPLSDPSLADGSAEFRALVDELFGNGAQVRRVGAGTVYAGYSVADALAQAGVPEDFHYRRDEGTRLEFVHRALSDADIYFVDNRSPNAISVDATFRVAGKRPELWRAETGAGTDAPFVQRSGRTTVPLELEPWGTAFIVFRQSTSEPKRDVPVLSFSEAGEVNGPWTVAFQPGRGAPAQITMAKLADWTTSSDAGVRYFSGVATYHNTLTVPAEWLASGSGVWLDLGEVNNLAVVKINGKEMPAWHAPFRVEVTSALHAGSNEIAIDVVNSWVNRLIGDEQPGATKVTFADVHPYKAKSPLLPSGLVGPVRVLRTETR